MGRRERVGHDRGRSASRGFERDEEALRRAIDRRVLPHNLAMEQSVLGGILLRNETLSLRPDLEPDDFYDPRHGIVFTAMRILEAASQPIDVVTLEAQMEKMGKLDAVGVAYLGELALRVPTADNVETYATEVINYRVRRDVALALSEMLEEVWITDDGEQLIHDVNMAMMRIRSGKENPVVSMGQLAAEEAQRFLADTEARARGERVYPGVPTGISQIDERCGGNPIGIMTLVIGRPGQGKTTFAMAFAEAGKRIADMDSLVCSYEDAGKSFGQRALAQLTGLGTERIKARRVDDHASLEAIRQAAVTAPQRRPEWFLDCSGWTVEQLIRRVRREQVKRKLMGKQLIRQVLVDYIQKMPIPEWARSREEGVGHISRVLSTFATTDDLAVVVFCQLNRELERRDDHRPRESDIRDSGSLEQDGKVIYGVYYPRKYDPRADENEVYLLVLKNAQGEALGEVKLYWDRPNHAIFNTPLEFSRARWNQR